MSRRIVLLSDGTGNAASKVWKSNVWRIFESLNLTGSEQVAFYDDGVGTSSFKPLAILGGAFGWGLKRNVLDIYKFLCANYTSPNDEIFGFGFSRGAFTMRVVIGLVLDQGLVKGGTDAELYRNAKLAYRAYRANKFHTRFRIEVPFRWLRDTIVHAFGVRYDNSNNHTVSAIKFLGLWDTVAAYGLPIDEMARGVSKWIWPLELPDRCFDHRIQRACHALALDDERTTFHPVLWNERGVPPGRLDQVWFAGVHSNVGGGYPDDSLAHIPLYWIMKEAEAQGLVFKTASSTDPDKDADPDMVVHAKWLRDKDGRLYDSRNGLGGYYRYGPRKLADLCDMKFSGTPGDEVWIETPKIHETAVIRAKTGAHRYAPIGLPRSYDVVTDSGPRPQSSLESETEAKIRCAAQESIWNIVWRRRIIYFVTVFASLYLLIYPLARDVPTADEYSTRLSLASDAVRMLGNVLPSAASPWVEAYARDPSHFLFVGFFAVLMIWLGSRLGADIESTMERIWGPDGKPASKSLLGHIVLGLAGIFAFYALGYSALPAALHLPADGHRWMTSYITTPIKIILLFSLLALLLPDAAVLHLRSAGAYRWFIRKLKLEILPLFFAIMFVLGGLAFASHLAFNVEDSSGLVCSESEAIAKADQKTRDDKLGLSACLAPGVATCSSKGKPVCGGSRPVYCATGVAACEFEPKAECDKDKDSNKCYAHAVCKDVTSSVIAGPASCPAKCEIEPQKAALQTLNIGEVCHATGVWLEQGKRYVLSVTPNDRWTDNGQAVSTRGIHVSDLPPWERFKATLLWPFKRDFFRPSFRVIARVGTTGNDEYYLDPDSDPTEYDLEEPIQPHRSGELFLYVNGPVLALPMLRDYFYRDNVGTATISVHRARQ